MTKKTVVMNVKSLGKEFVYIGRGSPWGNPFVVGKDGDRNSVIAKFKRHLWADKSLMSNLHQLEGKKLVCFCKPEKCHGDVLVAAIAWSAAERKRAAAELRATASGRRLSDAGYTIENLQP